MGLIALPKATHWVNNKYGISIQDFFISTLSCFLFIDSEFHHRVGLLYHIWMFDHSDSGIQPGTIPN